MNLLSSLTLWSIVLTQKSNLLQSLRKKRRPRAFKDPFVFGSKQLVGLYPPTHTHTLKMYNEAVLQHLAKQINGVALHAATCQALRASRNKQLRRGVSPCPLASFVLILPLLVVHDSKPWKRPKSFKITFSINSPSFLAPISTSFTGGKPSNEGPHAQVFVNGNTCMCCLSQRTCFPNLFK